MHANLERLAQDARLEVLDRLLEQTFELSDVDAGRGVPCQIRRAVVEHRARDVREVVQVLGRGEIHRVQEPLEVTQDHFAQPMQRQHATLARFALRSRFGVREPIE